MKFHSCLLLLWLLPGTGQAQEEPAPAVATRLEMYGRLDLSLDHGGGQTALTDNTSRLGFRGSEALGGANTVAYGIEFGINADTGSTVNPMLRNAWVALSGRFGHLALGRLDSANPAGSPLYSQINTWTEFVMHDAGASAIGTKILNARNRVANALAWRSPQWASWSARARFFQSDPQVGTCSSSVSHEGQCRQFDLALNFSGQAWQGGVAWVADRREGGLLPNDFRHKWQVLASRRGTRLKSWLILGQDHYQPASGKRNHIPYSLLGASLTLQGRHRLVANLMKRRLPEQNAGRLKRMQGGYSYHFSQRSMAYVLLDHTAGSGSQPRLRVVSLGMQQRF